MNLGEFCSLETEEKVYKKLWLKPARIWIQHLSPHTCAHAPSARLASPSLGKAWLAWHGMVSYGVLVTCHLICHFGSWLPQNCFATYGGGVKSFMHSSIQTLVCKMDQGEKAPPCQLNWESILGVPHIMHASSATSLPPGSQPTAERPNGVWWATDNNLFGPKSKNSKVSCF